MKWIELNIDRFYLWGLKIIDIFIINYAIANYLILLDKKSLI